MRSKLFNIQTYSPLDKKQNILIHHHKKVYILENAEKEKRINGLKILINFF
jgi:hypothetical protein